MRELQPVAQGKSRQGQSGDIAADPAEIADAQWFDIDDLPGMPPQRISISRALIDATVQRLRGERD